MPKEEMKSRKCFGSCMLVGITSRRSTPTSGDDPRANGRAEVAVQVVKTILRKALHEAEAEVDYWPMAARYINEVLRYGERGYKVNFPSFMKPVIARKRGWKRDELQPFSEEVRHRYGLTMDIGS